MNRSYISLFCLLMMVSVFCGAAELSNIEKKWHVERFYMTIGAGMPFDDRYDEVLPDVSLSLDAGIYVEFTERSGFFIGGGLDIAEEERTYAEVAGHPGLTLVYNNPEYNFPTGPETDFSVVMASFYTEYSYSILAEDKYNLQIGIGPVVGFATERINNSSVKITADYWGVGLQSTALASLKIDKEWSFTTQVRFRWLELDSDKAKIRDKRMDENARNFEQEADLELDFTGWTSMIGLTYYFY
jgi:hypothetical protein